MFRLRDAMHEAVAGATQRLGRTLLTAAGIAVGVGALVATLGLTSTTAAKISGEFDALKATQVGLSDVSPDGTPPFPADAERRALALNGTVSAGITWVVSNGASAASSRAAVISGGATVRLAAADPGYLEAEGVRLSSGVTFNAFDERAAAQVALVGRGLVGDVGGAGPGSMIFIDGRGFEVVGIIGGVLRDPALLNSIVVPDSTAARSWPGAGQDGVLMVIDTRPGAAQVVAGEAALAVRPDAPSRLIALTPPDPSNLRVQVEGSVAFLFAMLGVVSLIVGAIGIANMALVSVLERVPEIGLRRAVGAYRRHVAAQFILEGAVVGLLGGVIGSSIGILVVVGVSASHQWTTVIPPLLPVLAPLLGVLIGAVASLYPALRAARVEPVEALRR